YSIVVTGELDAPTRAQIQLAVDQAPAGLPVVVVLLGRATIPAAFLQGQPVGAMDGADSGLLADLAIDDRVTVVLGTGTAPVGEYPLVVAVKPRMGVAGMSVTALSSAMVEAGVPGEVGIVIDAPVTEPETADLVVDLAGT